MNHVSAQQGFVLVMALLYLLVVTLLVSSAFSSSLLQTKMSVNAQDAAIAFQRAESALLVVEKSIQSEAIKGQGALTDTAVYSYEKQTQPGCGVVFYQINVTGLYAKAKSHLQSLLAVPVGETKQCAKEPLRHRVYWWEVQ